ncbi:MAG: GTP cyclohydrolase II [Flavobacteriales bacterium]|nr:GTP cyclohydrolase II [Flavobacteriales bacterium]
MKKLVESRLPTEKGRFRIMAFGSEGDRFPHVVLNTEWASNDVPIVRIHSECMTGDLFHSSRCDCGQQLDGALTAIAKEGGVLIYLRQEGRGIGLVEKLRAYNLQDEGLDTMQANEALGHPVDARDYAAAIAILLDMGLPSVRLLTNNPEKVQALETGGIHVTERVPLNFEAGPENTSYLRVKKALMGHWIDTE